MTEPSTPNTTILIAGLWVDVGLEKSTHVLINRSIKSDELEGLIPKTPCSFQVKTMGSIIKDINQAIITPTPPAIPISEITVTDANFKLNKKVWSHYNWDITHCILRGENTPIKTNS